MIVSAAHSPGDLDAALDAFAGGGPGPRLTAGQRRCFDHKSQINDCSGADRPGEGAACRLSPEHRRPRRDRRTGAGPLSAGQDRAGAGSREDVVVIGAGAVGVCCAYFLARAGRSVRVLERDRICSGSSWGNSGLVTTSSCTPEAAPGVIGQALRWLLEPQGPFRLRPRIDAAFLRWLWRFRAQCTPEAAERSTRFLRDRVRDNAALVDRIAAESPLDFGWRRTGLIALYATERGLADGIAGAAALGRLEIPSQQLDAPAVARLEPRITGSVLGGILYPEDAHLDPGEFVTAVAGLARAHGARIDEGAPVVRLHGDGRIEAVETTAETIRPHVVVLANGAWAPALARGVRLPLLVEAGKGFSLTYPAARQQLRAPAAPRRGADGRLDDVRQRPRHEQARPGRRWTPASASGASARARRTRRATSGSRPVPPARARGPACGR